MHVLYKRTRIKHPYPKVNTKHTASISSKDFRATHNWQKTSSLYPTKDCKCIAGNQSWLYSSSPVRKIILYIYRGTACVWKNKKFLAVRWVSVWWPFASVVLTVHFLVTWPGVGWERACFLRPKTSNPKGRSYRPAPVRACHYPFLHLKGTLLLHLLEWTYPSPAYWGGGKGVRT